MEELLSRQSIEIIINNHRMVDEKIKDWVELEKKYGKLETISDDKRSLFDKWIQYRRQMKKPLKSKMSMNRLVKTMNEKPIEEVEFVVNLSIDNGWMGLFWDKYKPNKSSSKPNYHI